MDGIAYVCEPDLLMEAFVYLGALANGCDLQRLESRLREKGAEDISGLRQRYAPIAAIRQAVSDSLCLPQDRLVRLFCDHPGFPYNTCGAFSSAFLLLFPRIFSFDGDLDAFLQAAAARTPEQTARDMMLSLDMSDQDSAETNSVENFTAAILGLTVPAETKVALIETLRSAGTLIAETGSLLRPVMAALKKQLPALRRQASFLARVLEDTGAETYLRETTSLGLRSDGHYLIRPLLLAPDCNLFLDRTQADGSTVIYCGALRQYLLQQADAGKAHIQKLCEIFHLMADRTRMDILLYLRERPAYGQELADHFGLARNTIHHHMSKLYNAGLVTCTIDGARVYYALDREHLQELLHQQAELLL